MSTLFSDNFNRSNGGAGANWTDLIGTFNVDSNQCVGQSGAWLARCNGTAPASDCWSEIDFAALPSGADASSHYLRVNLGTNNGYRWRFLSTGLDLQRIDAGVATTVGALISLPSAGAKVRFESRGSDHLVYYDDVLQATRSDANHSGSFQCLIGGEGTSWRGDNFAEGSLPTISSATPSGTIGTQTTATIGCTTDDSTGTLYVVVDTASLSGITATQIKAGQNASSAAADASGNSAVSGSTPSVGVSGLSASTAYNYAILQFSGGNSNILTGTFTTADPPPSQKTLYRLHTHDRKRLRSV